MQTDDGIEIASALRAALIKQGSFADGNVVDVIDAIATAIGGTGASGSLTAAVDRLAEAMFVGLNEGDGRRTPTDGLYAIASAIDRLIEQGVTCYHQAN